MAGRTVSKKSPVELKEPKAEGASAFQARDTSGPKDCQGAGGGEGSKGGQHPLRTPHQSPPPAPGNLLITDCSRTVEAGFLCPWDSGLSRVGPN